ncbi:MAG: phosphatase PAP2 family protein [Verrucomicrobiia bacterium]
MSSFESFDVAVFRFINVGLKNPFFDWLLPFFDSNLLFVPVLALLAITLTWKGGVRARLFVCFMLLTLVIGDPLIVRSLKAFFDRPRPFDVLEDIHLLVHGIDNPSMPSGHAANWFAAAVISFVYYRRSIWFMLPMAFIEGFSRTYLGVHYPSDVLAGALIGVAYAVLIVWTSDRLWKIVGARWFPLWHERLPSVLNPRLADGVRRMRPAPDHYWTRLGGIFIVVLFLGHLAYIAFGRIELSPSEAYVWLWSKHLSLEHLGLTPLPAVVQWVSNNLLGDTAFGIRFFAPVAGVVTAWIMLRVLSREADGFVGFLLVLAATATPLLMAGVSLMLPATLATLCWTAALATGWAALKRDLTPAWLWTGLWIGLGSLAQITVLVQWVCWLAFFLVWPAARHQLRRPGPVLGLLISLGCTLPLWVLNRDGGLAVANGLAPAVQFGWQLPGAEFVLLNPVFFLGLVWGSVRFWRSPQRGALEVCLFCMAVPLILLHLGLGLFGRWQLGWIAPAVLPLLALMLFQASRRWNEGAAWVPHALMAGISVGWLIVVPLHDPKLVSKLVGTQLKPQQDPLAEVLGWSEVANTVERERRVLLAEGKPVFIIGGDPGITALLSFYLPGPDPGHTDRPLVYGLSERDANALLTYLPGYAHRKGENALYVALADGELRSPPQELHNRFTALTNPGTRDILYKKRVLRRIQLIACRDLR